MIVNSLTPAANRPKRVGLRMTPMSGLGHFQMSPRTAAMSAHPSIADIAMLLRHVHLVPDSEVAAHSITSSARPRIVAGISNLSALAVFRLIANSDFVGSWTGKSAGLAPHLPPSSVDKSASFGKLFHVERWRLHGLTNIPADGFPIPFAEGRREGLSESRMREICLSGSCRQRSQAEDWG